MGKLSVSALLIGFLTACGAGSATLLPGTDRSSAGDVSAAASGASGDGAGAQVGDPNGTPPNAQADAGAATFDGTIRKTSFNPTNAIFALGKGANGVTQLAIKLSDQADDCAVVTAGAHRSGAESLWIRIEGAAANAPTVTLGDATRSGTQAYAQFYVLDSNCVTTLSAAQAGSKSGTVDLQVGDPNGIATGQFTLTMGTQGDQVAGTFAAAPCPGLLSLVADPNLDRSCE